MAAKACIGGIRAYTDIQLCGRILALVGLCAISRSALSQKALLLFSLP